MLNVFLFVFAFLLLFYSKISPFPTPELDNLAIHTLYCLTVSTCVVLLFKSRCTIKNVYTINCIIHREIQRGALVGYLLSGIPSRSALDFLFDVLKYPGNFLYNAGNFSYYTSIMLFALQSLLSYNGNAWRGKVC